MVYLSFDRVLDRQKTSSAPRFAIGIQDETYGYADQYCKDYGYPLGAPLSLSVDDTKLHAALCPLYNGPLGKWFIVGTTGEPMEVPNADALNDTLDELEKTAEVATKVSPFRCGGIVMCWSLTPWCSFIFGSCRFPFLRFRRLSWP
jgi:hypothetical protein